MIKNDKQYQVTKKRLLEFNNILSELEGQSDIDPLYQRIQIDAVKSQIEEFEFEIKEYEGLKNGIVSYVIINSVEDLHEALIKARLAKGLTQAELANKMNIKEQQIQRYEACNYSTASLPRVVQVAQELGVSFNPIKVKFNEPHFEIPREYNQELVMKAQATLKRKKSLIQVS